jgi:hypothetical protein
VLESVTVYAQKRAATLQDVPVSMSTLSGDELASAGIYSISDVAAATPTLDIQTSVSPITTTLRIRRVGSLGNIPTFEPDVGLFVDGAFRSRSLLSAGDLLMWITSRCSTDPRAAVWKECVCRRGGGLPEARDFFSSDAELTGGLIDAPGSADSDAPA